MLSLISATIWSSVQRFGGLAISFVSNIVLARLLSPEDYGIVGLIMVFIGIADVLIDGGLGNALIQKKELSQDDISTVFTSNFLISLFLFLIIFFSAPYIASYVEIEKFCLYLRIEAIMILVRALIIVHYSLMVKQMDFRKLAIIGLGVNFLTTSLAIGMALYGCGIWSLIVRNLAIDVFCLIIYFLVFKVKLSIYISKKSFSQLFSFGIFVAIANLVESLYSNILSFILGKRFSVQDLGYYNQAYALEQIPVYSLTAILNQVFFPFLSKEQDNREKMRSDVKMSIQAMSFIIYPMMAFLIFFAEPIIVLLYSDKWLPSVPFFQILCAIGFTNFIYHLNRSIMKAVGKSRVLFYTQIAVSVIGLLLIALAIPFGIIAVVVSVALNSIVAMMIVVCYAGKYIQMNLYQQLYEVFLNLILSLLVGIFVYWLFSQVSLCVLIMLPLAFLFYAIVYFFAHYLIGSSSYKMTSSKLIVYYHQRYKK